MSLATKSGKFSAREFKEWSRFLFCKEIGRALLFEMRGLSSTGGLPEPSGIGIWRLFALPFLEVNALQFNKTRLPFSFQMKTSMIDFFHSLFQKITSRIQGLWEFVCEVSERQYSQFIIPMEAFGIDASDHLYPLKPKNPI